MGGVKYVAFKICCFFNIKIMNLGRQTGFTCDRQDIIYFSIWFVPETEMD